ncbi:MAG: YIP1 family protein [Methanomicrobiales archaeon]|nr:YIP1 family protein [Methanomicrobiales archaeon]
MASSFVKDIQNFILSPVAAFRSSRQSSIARAFLYYAVLLVLHAAASFLLVMATLRRVDAGLSGAFYGPILSGLAILALGGLVLQIGVMLLGGRRGLAPTCKAAMYAATPWLLFGWFPMVGPIPVLWSLGLLAIGIRELQGISLARSAGVVLFAVVVGFVTLLISLSRIV